MRLEVKLHRNNISRSGTGSLKMRWAPILFILLLITGTANMSGQNSHPYAGMWYISNYDTEYYMVPASNPQRGNKEDAYFSSDYSRQDGDPEKPFVTTYITGQIPNVRWILVPVQNEADYYYIVHAITGKYLIYMPVSTYTGDNVRRKFVHLEDCTVPNESHKFQITALDGYVKIKPKNNAMYLNVAGGNQSSYNGSTNNKAPYYSGLIGGMNGTDNGSKFNRAATLFDAPLINDPNQLGLATVTVNNGLPAGYNIRYTFGDGTQADPDASSSIMNQNGFLVETTGVLKAVIERYGIVISEMASKTLVSIGLPPDPEITLSDECSNTITINPFGLTIYYTTDGTEPSKTNGTLYTGPFQQNTNATIKAVSFLGQTRSENIASYSHTAKTLAPVITINGNVVTIAGQGNIYYTTDGTEPSNSSMSYNGPIVLPDGNGVVTIKAIAQEAGKQVSCVEVQQVSLALFISSLNDLNRIHADDICKVTADFDASGYEGSISIFSGEFDGGLYTISGLSHPLFDMIDGGTVKNVILKDVSISGDSDGDAGAICYKAQGTSTIYNCGILPTATTRDPDGNISGFTGSSVSGSRNVGSLVGLLDGQARVINCFSYATVSGGSMMGGIVGNNAQTSTMTDIKTIVVNCMFYGEITGAGSKFPVYGGNVIENSGATAINNYNYYRESALFDDDFILENYNRSWPAEERNLTRFEYYRSILNSNRRLCTWWVNGQQDIAPTDELVDEVGIAKWVLDPSIAPYPILKQWGKYPSIINPDPARCWDPQADNGAGNWQARSTAAPYRGKSHGTLTVTVNTGSYPASIPGLNSRTETIYPVITEMDTLNYDYGYYKIQLPYYNEVFGSNQESDYKRRYWGNYTTMAVTGWKITAVTDDGRTRNAFVKDWENGYNYADRNCTAKDIYTSNDGRAFAQGGYYYVPEGVTAITIEAYWGKAFYLHAKDHALDRVNVTASKNYGNAFTPAGTLPTTMPYNDIAIYDDFNTLMEQVKADKSCNVYDQAVVLVGNYPLHAQNDIPLGNECSGGFTIMSADFDMDNEPDFCLPLQWRTSTNRLPIMPIRFDFLPVPELGLAMRHNTYAYALGIFVPEGHFEITETAFMHTTQFEYMSSLVAHTGQQPLILNGGQFEQIVAHGANNTPSLNKTRNIILGGHIWMKRFSPGSHTQLHCITRHCAVSVMGGDFPEFYLTGIYWTNVTTSNAFNDSPHCYTNGGRFGIMAGAGMEAVRNNVHFEIDNSVIDEFYGGGINSNNPVAGNIEVTINNSLVLNKYCGGPKVGTCGSVTTSAKGTVFNQYFGGGNGGTNLYREQILDQTPNDMPNQDAWNGTYGFTAFNPIAGQGESVTYDNKKGYHAEFEFEVFNQSNGLGKDAVARTYRHWAQFGTTTTGNVSNTLTDCIVLHNFYGGGNLALVNGTVTSTLTGNTQIIGSAFGAGYSASVPSFKVHDKSTVSYPMRDGAGVCHNGSVSYRTDGGVAREYTWCYKNSSTKVVTPAGVVIPDGVSTSKPAFQYDGKWYCYTTVSLENLGTVNGDIELNIQGNSLIQGLEFDENGVVSSAQTGGVFGGGDASGVSGDIEVNIAADGQQSANSFDYNTFNVFGGGNKAIVNGNTTVTLTDGVINNDVFGGGNEAEVTGSTVVNITEQ